MNPDEALGLLKAGEVEANLNGAACGYRIFAFVDLVPQEPSGGSRFFQDAFHILSNQSY